MNVKLSVKFLLIDYITIIHLVLLHPSLTNSIIYTTDSNGQSFCYSHLSGFILNKTFSVIISLLSKSEIVTIIIFN
jgi:hypothetical protein